VIKDLIKEAETRMHAAIQNLDDDLSGIRTGRATPALVEKMPVEYYGASTPLLQLASISVPEPRSLLIKPFDPASMKNIERQSWFRIWGLPRITMANRFALTYPP